MALVSDIAEMYLRIKVPPEDRPYQRFQKSEERPDVYEFSSVVFKTNSSPFQAQLVAKHLLRQTNGNPKMTSLPTDHQRATNTRSGTFHGKSQCCLLGPYTIRAKMLLQEMWTAGCVK